MRIVQFIILLVVPTLSFGRDALYEALTNQVDNLTLTLSVRPVASGSPDTGGGLRSALLYVSSNMVIEPPAKWPDGSFVSASRSISSETMRRILEVLHRRGLLTNSAIYYSERTTGPKGSPPAKEHISKHLASGWKAKTAELRLGSLGADYYTAHIVSVRWGEQLASLLRELSSTMSGSSAETILTDLGKTYERFR